MIGQWSAFKLFYKFRYTYIIEYLMEIFHNNHTNFESSLNSQADKIVKEFESQLQMKNNENTRDNKNTKSINKNARKW